MPQSISPQELAQRLQAGESLVIVDVRTPAEFQEIHLDGARNVPLDRLQPQECAKEFGCGEGKPLYIVCRSGSRGRQACDKFASAGIPHVINVDGGTMACEAAGLKVVRGRKAISLERQVRIAAGALVLTGALLSFVHPYWAGLAAFVGAGLMFAGITDTCGMAILLGRMPWNQASGSSCSTNK